MANNSCLEECKIILLGLDDAGKTSIYEVIFEGKNPAPTKKGTKKHKIKSKLIKLAGQEIQIINVGEEVVIVNDLFNEEEEDIYSDVKAAIFVIDISDAANINRSKKFYNLIQKFFSEHNKHGLTYIFAHKADLVSEDELESIIDTIEEVYIDKNDAIEIYGTSIYNETIWMAMQRVISAVYPTDKAKIDFIKGIAEDYKLKLLTLSTSQGIILYSYPNVDVGFNFGKIKNEITKALFPSLKFDYAIFPYEKSTVFIKDIEKNLVLTVAFPDFRRHNTAKRHFKQISNQILNTIEREKVLDSLNEKILQNLISLLESENLENIDVLSKKLAMKYTFKCDICSKEINNSLLDVAKQYSGNLQKGIEISKGFGDVSIEIYPIHDCKEGKRIVPVLLDRNLEYRRYDDSRPA